MLLNSLLFRRIPQTRYGFMIYSRSYKKKCENKVSTMDDLPLPKGEWRLDYNKNNAYYNKVLYIGIASLVTVIGFGLVTECIYYRYRPPGNC